MCHAFGQDVSFEQKGDNDFQVSSEKFFTDESGNIKMVVNVWGHVNSPGLHEVYDGIDLATLLSMVGGPKSGANLNASGSKHCLKTNRRGRRAIRNLQNQAGQVICL